MKRILIIIPYFGTFPNYFQLFLNSCKTNETIDWLIVTDNTENYQYPQNVKVVRMEFSDLQKGIRRLFDFEVAIDKPYKLCDLRPAYGYIFSEYITGYDYWGHGDCDLIYGDLRKFLTSEVLSYDKVFDLGHLSLYRNLKEMNEMFMKPLDGVEYYKKVFSSPLPFNFDERFLDRKNINQIIRNEGYSIFDKTLCADIGRLNRFNLIVDGKSEPVDKTSLFVWNNGKLVRFQKKNAEVMSREYLYIHMQKRKMKVELKDEVNATVYKIIPNVFEDLEVSVDEINADTYSGIRKYHVNFHYIKLRLKNLKTKIKVRLGGIR